MTGISKDAVSYKLNIDPNVRPIDQKRRKFTPERNLIIQEEVERFCGFLKRSNVPKMDSQLGRSIKEEWKWKVCMGFGKTNCTFESINRKAFQ